MTRHNLCFLLLGTLCAGGVIAPATAAPTVKKLGVSSNNNYVQSGAKTVSKTSAPSSTSTATSSILRPSTSSRGASVRSGVSSAKPMTVSKTTANTAASVSKTTNATSGVDAANARLSVGKYIHNSGVNSGYIKPVSTTNEAEAQSHDILNLFDRVHDLEAELDKKQNTLSAGNGIDIDDDTVSVSDVMWALPGRVDTLEQGLNNKVDATTLEDYYNKTEVQENITNTVNTAVTTAQQSGDVYMTNVNTNTREKVSFVNVFDEGVLLSNISGGQQIGNENLNEQENGGE